MSFSFSDLNPALQRGIEDLGFTEPTPIQASAIPPGLDGRDILAAAMTGSGKTASFLLPILERLLDRGQGTTRALVLAPTRELAAQIVEHFEALARHTPFTAAAVYGGVGMKPQEKAFRQGTDVIVACPGRLLDHFQYPHATLEGLEVLVLDEADRMLDMGFLPDIRRVLKHLPEVQQRLLFSATLPEPIVTLSRDLLRDPVSINVERKSAPATGVRQAVYPVRQDLKSRLLLALLQSGEIDNVLVFTRTKHRADRLTKFLSRHEVACDRIHGNRSQPQRTKALAAFKDGDIRVLVATDIAARGIDVEALSHVVNFDVPNIPEDYIHRVGRTARAAATGEAFTFVSEQERGELHAIERAVGERLPRSHHEGFDYDAPAAGNLEIPLGERIAVIRARKAEERARSREKARLKAERESQRGKPPADNGEQSPGNGMAADDQTGNRRRRKRRSRGRKERGAGQAQRRQPKARSRPQPDTPSYESQLHSVLFHKGVPGAAEAMNKPGPPAARTRHGRIAFKRMTEEETPSTEDSAGSEGHGEIPIIDEIQPAVLNQPYYRGQPSFLGKDPTPPQGEGHSGQGHGGQKRDSGQGPKSRRSQRRRKRPRQGQGQSQPQDSRQSQGQNQGQGQGQRQGQGHRNRQDGQQGRSNGRGRPNQGQHSGRKKPQGGQGAATSGPALPAVPWHQRPPADGKAQEAAPREAGDGNSDAPKRSQSQPRSAQQ